MAWLWLGTAGIEFAEGEGLPPLCCGDPWRRGLKPDANSDPLACVLFYSATAHPGTPGSRPRNKKCPAKGWALLESGLRRERFPNPAETYLKINSLQALQKSLTESLTIFFRLHKFSHKDTKLVCFSNEVFVKSIGYCFSLMLSLTTKPRATMYREKTQRRTFMRQR
jgi:hypothetical protein